VGAKRGSTASAVSEGRSETAEAVSGHGSAGATPLKRGVNEKPGGTGSANKAVLLPSNEKADDRDLAHSLKIGILMPGFEQFHGLSGFYGQEFSDSATYERHYYRNYTRRGFKPMMYCGFGVEPVHDAQIAPFADEVSLKPRGMVYTAVYPNYATPYRDYLIWAVKQSVDQYGVRALHLDNTVSHRTPMFDPFLDCGFVDEHGKEHPRWPYFAARNIAKRLRWLVHVHTTGGHINLGAGSRKSPFACGFVDVVMSGEGGYFYSAEAWENMKQPEDYGDCDQYRQGVPYQTITKGGLEHKFSPNLTFMYTLLVRGSLRVTDFHISPTCWYESDESPGAASIAGDYNPYFAKAGVPEVAAPMTPWWMLTDDFDCEHAEFAPFFRSGEYMKVTPDRLRSALYWHPGKAALVIVCNFTNEEAPAEVKLDLAKLGLTGKKLVAWDAFTDDEYPVTGDTVKVTIPVRNYRLVRVEAQ
jgi:hypothetical protein